MEDQQEAPGLRLPGRCLRVLSFRLLAVDLDGTLVDAAGVVHAEDKLAISALAKKGVPTTIITGRLYSGTRHIAREIGASDALGCVDGCHLVHGASGKELHHGGLGGTGADRVRQLLARRGVTSFVFSNDRIYHDEGGVAYLDYVRTWSVDHEQVESVTDERHWENARGVTALVCIGNEATIRSVENEIRTSLGHAVYAIAFPIRRAASSPGWGMVVRAAGYSKGTALVWLAAHYGVAASEVVAVGDWFNDVPMFEVAGRSFVMGQAPDDVKATASDCLRADSSTGGGIAEAALRAGLL